MAVFQFLMLMFFGVGILVMVYRSLANGWLPCGASLTAKSGRFEVHREQRPILYWVVFAAYTGAGVALIVYAVRILVGNMEPLPLR